MGENDAAEWQREPVFASAAAVDGATAPPLRLGKDVSMGEYDPTTGLTYVTRQRGRLHFNMGANAIKQAHAAAAVTKAETRAQCETQNQSGVIEASDSLPVTAAISRALLTLHLRTGAFTGLALYPEEAYYLLQRGALVIFKMEQQSTTEKTAADEDNGRHAPERLSLAHFAGLLLRHQKASLACLDVYAFLKENKFHPRRHQEEITPTDAVPDELNNSCDATTMAASQEASLGAAAYSQPQHLHPGINSACQFAYDVWKSTTETLYIPNEGHKPSQGESTPALNSSTAEEVPFQEPKHAPEPPVLRPASSYVKRKKDTSTKKRKVKRLRLVFRVVVCRFADAMPPPSALAALVVTSGAQPLVGDSGISGAHVPVKVAVVDQDKSVLFFEVG